MRLPWVEAPPRVLAELLGPGAGVFGAPGGGDPPTIPIQHLSQPGGRQDPTAPASQRGGLP